MSVFEQGLSEELLVTSAFWIGPACEGWCYCKVKFVNMHIKLERK